MDLVNSQVVNFVDTERNLDDVITYLKNLVLEKKHFVVIEDESKAFI